MTSTDQVENVTPLHQGAEQALTYRTPPHNLDAEMALLGAILVNNRTYERTQEFLLWEHFADAANGKIYEAAGRLIERGQLATAVTLKNYLDNDPDVSGYGGQEYLARLANSVFTISNAVDLAHEVYDCYVRRELIDVGSEVVNSAYEHKLDENATNLIEQAEARLFDLAERGQTGGGLQEFKSALVTAIEVAEAAYKRDTPLVGLSTGFRDLDEKLGGLHKSDLVIVAARPSMGKTAFATNVSYAIAQSRRRSHSADGTTVEEPEVVAFFSLEMSSEQLAGRILSDAAMVRSDAIRRGDVREEEYNRVFAASQALHKLPLFIDDTPALSIAAIRTRARRLKRQHGLSMIVVDYLQLAAAPASSRNDNRVQEVSEITRGLKAIAKELDVPVIALSQLSRAVEQREDKRPQLSDLRESGSIEQDADVVMFLFREEYYLAREDASQREHEKDDSYARRMQRLETSRNVAEIIIAKQRHGPIGTVKLHFNPEFTRFGDLKQPDHLPEPRT